MTNAGAISSWWAVAKVDVTSIPDVPGVPGGGIPIGGHAEWLPPQQGTRAQVAAKFPDPQYVIRGPFPTETTARAFMSAHPTRSVGVNPPRISNPLTYLGEIGHFFGVLVTHLTDIHMWISLAWIALGAWLFIAGIVLWLRIPQRGLDFATSAAARAI